MEHGMEIPEPHVKRQPVQWTLGENEMDKVLEDWFKVVEVCLTPCPGHAVAERNKVSCLESLSSRP